MTAAPSPFSTTIPHWQTTWDSTSLGWLKTCPRSYYYQMILGYQPRSRSIHLVFGGLYAGALERYAHAKAAGASHDEATLRMVRWALEASGEYVPIPDCTACGGKGEVTLTKYDDQGTAVGEWFQPCRCRVWEPWTPTDPDANIKNRYTLVRALVWNAEDRLISPFRTHILSNGKPAVELSFALPVAEIEGEVISLSGHMDEVVEEEDGSMWVRDDKTSKHVLDAPYFTRYTPDNQMSLYSFAGKVILSSPVRGVLVKAAQMQVGGTRFRTQPIPRPQAVLDEWFQDALGYIRQARGYAEANHWPMNDKACYLCAFKRVCAVSPSHREAHLKSDFERRVWNPLQARGDI